MNRKWNPFMRCAFVAGPALAFLVGCANHQPTKQMAMSTPGFLNEADAIERQRPVLPVTHYLKWHTEDRLHHGIELDYISGMSQRDYLFEEPNQGMFRPMVQGALRQSQLESKTAAGARYALQIEFTEIDTAFFWRNFAGKTKATYRIVDRRTEAVVYESEIKSNFVADFTGLNEDDASFAYDVSSPGVIGATQVFGAFTLAEGGLVELWNNNRKLRDFFGGSPVQEASQAVWNDAYQGYVWTTGLSAISGPFLVLLDQLKPTNYISLQLEPSYDRELYTSVREGNMAERGLGERSARKRAQQLNSHILAQSLTRFLHELSVAENVSLTQLVACKDADFSATEMIEEVRSRMRVVTDDCRQYLGEDNSRGVPFFP
jgi:hypothetical protein